MRVGGNIGQAVTGLVEGSTDATTFVLEVSSFQLEGTDTFHPQVARVPEPLRRPPRPPRQLRGVRAGQGAHLRATRPTGDWAVVNADDPGVLALARGGRARGIVPSTRPGAARRRRRSSRATRRGCGATGGDEDALPPRATCAARRPPGRATCWPRRPRPACWARPRRRSRRAVRAFRGVEHVLERVADIGGVAFFNDSKATNVDAARKSLEAFAGPVLADPRRPLQGRRLRRPARPPCARTARPCSPSARRATAIAARPGRDRARRALRLACARRWSAAWPLAAARRHRAAGARLLVVRHVRGLRRARPRLQGRGAGGWPETRQWLRSSPRTRSLFAVTVALLGLGLVMVWSASSGARPGAPRQRLPLPDPAGGLGLRSGLVVHGGGHAARLPQAAPARRSSTRRWLGTHAPPHRRPVPARR